MSWRVYHDRLLLGRCYRGFALPVLGFCSTVCCSAPVTHHKLLDHVVSCASFSTWGVFEYDIAHRRSVAVLCMLNNIRSNPMYPLSGALRGLNVSVRITSGDFVAQRYNYYVPNSWRSSQYRRAFISMSYLCGTIFVTPYSMV